MPKWEERFDHIDDVLDTEQARGAVESAAEFPRPELSASPPRVPAGTIIQAPKRTAIECPECIEAEPDIETHHAAIRADERARVLKAAAAILSGAQFTLLIEALAAERVEQEEG